MDLYLLNVFFGVQKLLFNKTLNQGYIRNSDRMILPAPLKMASSPDEFPMTSSNSPSLSRSAKQTAF